MSEPMDEVRANTTPGTDPRVEEMTRPPMHHGSMEDREMEGRQMSGESMDDRTMEGRRAEGRPIEGDRMHGDMYGDEGGTGRMDATQTSRSADDPVAHYRTRFAEAQSRFIDDPKSALEEARSVVEEAVDKYMDSLRMDAGAGNGDTEHMRRAMQRYRDLFDRLAGGRA